MFHNLPNVSCYWTLWLFLLFSVNFFFFFGQCFSENLNVLCFIFLLGLLLMGNFQKWVRRLRVWAAEWHHLGLGTHPSPCSCALFANLTNAHHPLHLSPITAPRGSLF